jgi:hypothetical protein
VSDTKTWLQLALRLCYSVVVALGSFLALEAGLEWRLLSRKIVIL